jgi:hypothetical protein
MTTQPIHGYTKSAFLQPPPSWIYTLAINTDVPHTVERTFSLATSQVYIMRTVRQTREGRYIIDRLHRYAMLSQNAKRSDIDANLPPSRPNPFA